jgi:hypothetical protein
MQMVSTRAVGALMPETLPLLDFGIGLLGGPIRDCDQIESLVATAAGLKYM